MSPARPVGRWIGRTFSDSPCCLLENWYYGFRNLCNILPLKDLLSRIYKIYSTMCQVPTNVIDVQELPQIATKHRKSDHKSPPKHRKSAEVTLNDAASYRNLYDQLFLVRHLIDMRQTKFTRFITMKLTCMYVCMYVFMHACLP